jgi:hypothetical protein
MKISPDRGNRGMIKILLAKKELVLYEQGNFTQGGLRVAMQMD